MKEKFELIPKDNHSYRIKNIKSTGGANGK